MRYMHGMSALAHCSNTSHPSVDLVGSTLVEDYFTRRFVSSSKNATDHYTVGAGSNCLCDITAELDSTIGNYRNVGFLTNRNYGLNGG